MIDISSLNALFIIQLVAILVMLWLTVLMSKKLNTKTYFENFKVLVPFRNEGDRIRKLIESFNNSILRDEQEVQIIFINDHSSDATAFIIKNELKLPFEIIDLKSHRKILLFLNKCNFYCLVASNASILRLTP